MLFSDGVSDNLFINKAAFKKCLTKYLDKDGLFTSLSAAADCIAIKAHALGKNTNFISPFAVGAQEAGLFF